MNIADLTQSYAAKTDEELLDLSFQREHLTIEAQAALSSELSRRRIILEAPVANIPTVAIHPSRQDIASPPLIRTGPFIEEVLRFYTRHRWVFMQFIFPAVLISFIAIIFTRNEARAIAQGLRAEYGFRLPPLVLLRLSLITGSGLLTSWLVFCASFAAISFAVEQERVGYQISVRESFSALWERFGPFLRLSMLLLGMEFALTMAVLTPTSIWIIPLIERYFSPFSSLGWLLSGYLEFGFIALILARFSLAIPAIVLDGYSVTDSLFLSYELTRQKWAILTALVFKGVFVSYLAGKLPFCLLRFIPAGTLLPWWFDWVLSAASILCVTVVEPIMFIGFAMLYLKTTTPDVVQTQSASA